MARALVVLALLAAACAAPGPRSPTPPLRPSPRPPSAPAPAPEAPSPIALTLAPGEVAVRLSALEGAASVRVEGAGAREYRREGALVLGPDGVGVPYAVLAPASGQALTTGGRAYSARLLIEPRRAGGLSVVALVELESYVRSVVAAEIPLWSAPPAWIEAQAVAARTYALYTLRARGGARGGAFLWDSTVDQMYRGDELEATLSPAVSAKLGAALAHTRDLVLAHHGVLFEALYHAACGGRTAAVETVLDRRRQAPLSPVPCPPCARLAQAGDASLSWRCTASSTVLAALARGHGLGERLLALRPAQVDAAGRWLSVELTGERGKAVVPARELRAALGVSTMKSTLVRRTSPAPSAPLGAELVLEGLGRGHGAGLCQTGGRGLADLGADARGILAHFYSGATLVPWRSLPGVGL